jgi:cytochrome P450
VTDALHFPLMFSRNGLDPIAELGERRAAEPVSKLELPFGITAWLVTGYDAAKEVLGDAASFSNAFGNLTTSGTDDEQDPGGLGMTDPPYHTRLRKMLTPEFTMRRLNRLKPRIVEIVDQQLDAIEQAGQPADLVETFAMPIPSLVICELLGVPYADREGFQALSTARFDLGDDSPLDVIGTSLDYLQGLVVAERANPGEGLLGMLIREHGDDIDDRELAGLADGLLTGGHETTASSLSLGALALMQSPEYFARLGAADDATAHLAVEELLRYLTVVQVAFPRFAKSEVVIGGQQIPAGVLVLVSLSAADRDAVLAGQDGGAHPNMETFDPTRPATSHLAFGYGIHRCVGAELARMELRIAFPALARRFPTMRPAVPMGELSFRDSSIVYSAETMPVVW